MTGAKGPGPRSTAAQEIAGFLAKYDPRIVSFATAARRRARRLVPGGIEFVYDNYGALVFGYGPTERASQAVLSLALYPRWVTLCFLKGAALSDPQKLLRGSGNVVRHFRLNDPAQLEAPEVLRLIRQAIRAASPAFPADGPPRTVIKSVSAKQRPRRSA